MRILSMLILLLALVACTPTTGSPTADTIPTPTREGSVITGETNGDNGSVTGDLGIGFGVSELPNTPFAALVTGAEAISISGDGAFGCENGLYVIRSSASDFPQVSLILPSNASTGEFALSTNQGDGATASASLFFADGRVFAGGVDGLLVIESLATAPTQQIIGSFVFTANNGGAEVEVQGQFSFIALPTTVFCEG